MSASRVAQSGFTLVEVAISLTVFILLVASLFGLSTQMTAFAGASDLDFSVQVEGSRATERMTEVLRKSGRVTSGGVTYPRVVEGGSALEFRLLADLDLNGYAFAQESGDLEWDPRVFTLSADEDGDLRVVAGGVPLYSVARNVSALRFETAVEDSALDLRELSFSFEVRRDSGKGYDAVHSVEAVVWMRN
jgi:type II secretory pathway pseudopilin PulG